MGWMYSKQARPSRAAKEKPRQDERAKGRCWLLFFLLYECFVFVFFFQCAATQEKSASLAPPRSFSLSSCVPSCFFPSPPSPLFPSSSSPRCPSHERRHTGKQTKARPARNPLSPQKRHATTAACRPRIQKKRCTHKTAHMWARRTKDPSVRPCMRRLRFLSLLASNCVFIAPSPLPFPFIFCPPLPLANQNGRS